MATFAATVERITVRPHPDADALELAQVGLYDCVVGKDLYQTGDLVVYIPEASVVPADVIELLGLTGKLAGKDKNRVKAIRLRGVMSQGVTYPVEMDNPVGGVVQHPDGRRLPVTLGDDVTEFLGITKYEPPIPAAMAGEVYNAFGRTINYDIENIKRYPDIFIEGEEVVVTEKIHGTWCQLGIVPEEDGSYTLVVSSKGMASQGLAFQLDSPANASNLYVRVARKLDIVNRVLAKSGPGLGEPLFILGEVYGQGIQKKFDYGANAGHDATLGFRVFDIYTGHPGQGLYCGASGVQGLCEMLELDSVPVIYRGPFSIEKMEELASGTETVTGEGLHIREGIVIAPVQERRHDMIGRVKLKWVSDEYLGVMQKYDLDPGN